MYDRADCKQPLKYSLKESQKKTFYLEDAFEDTNVLIWSGILSGDFIKVSQKG